MERVNLMKAFFSYAFGYVNIQDNSLFLTRSGNWSEVEEMKTQTPGKIGSHMHKWRILLFMTVVIVAFLFTVLHALHAGNGNSVLSLVLLGIGAFSVYRYLQKDLGRTAHISLDQIYKIDFEITQVTIHFYNHQQKDSSIILEKVESKGIELLHTVTQVNLKP